MANVDKNQAIIDFLSNCPSLKDNAMFFNFIKAKDNNKQIATIATDKTLDTPYIDGSVLKRYEFTFIDYKSATYNPLVMAYTQGNENVDDMLDVQSIMDWVTEQADSINYPNFGDKCEIDDMNVLTNMPNINGIDTSTSMPLAKYSFTIRIEYIDNTKRIW